jgi:hypothetical protein
MTWDLASFLEFLARETAYAFPYWIGGSFVTSKPEPTDIDLIVDLSVGTERQQNACKAITIAIRGDLASSHRIELSCRTADDGPGRLHLFQGYAVPGCVRDPRDDEEIRGILHVEPSLACVGYARVSKNDWLRQVDVSATTQCCATLRRRELAAATT